MTRVDTASPATADELDAAILASLRAAPGQFAAWRYLREQLLVSATLSAKAESLVRLEVSGQVIVWKDGLGRNYCGLAIARPTRRSRRRAA
jgi:hypothetical protein